MADPQGCISMILLDLKDLLDHSLQKATSLRENANNCFYQFDQMLTELIFCSHDY